MNIKPTEFRELSRYTKIVLLAIAFAQGWLLLIADKLIDNNYEFIWFVLIVAAPGLLLFLVHDVPRRWPWLLSLFYGFILTLLALYTSLQCDAMLIRSCSSKIIAPYFNTQIIAWFITLFFFQVWLEVKSLELPYTRLFDYSWHNAVTIGLTLLLVGIFWALLGLWASLFKILGIAFFQKLFFHEIFAYPATGLVAGAGIVTFRSQINAVDTVRRILRVLMWALLPLLSVITLLFLLTLPVTGLQALWDTGKATNLMMWLVALTLFFTNAVFQDGKGEMSYPKVLRWLIYASLVVLPIYIVLSIYGLGLRVNQYGWSVARLWVAIILFLLAGFAVAYSAAVVLKRDQWLRWFSPVNKTMALIIIAVCIFVNSPLLDLRKITIKSQIASLEGGDVTWEAIDFEYLRFDLGRPGKEALEKLLASEPTTLDEEAREYIRDLLAMKRKSYQRTRKQVNSATLLQHMTVIPQGQEVPKELLARISGNYELKRCYDKGESCILLAIDLVENESMEYVLFQRHESHKFSAPYERGIIYIKGKDGWYSFRSLRDTGKWSWEYLVKSLKAGDYGTLSTKWRDLRIGYKRLTTQP